MKAGKATMRSKAWLVFAGCAAMLLATKEGHAADKRPIASLDRWHLGLNYFQRGEYAAALPVLEEVAIRPMPDAMLMAGTMYWLGQGTTVDRARGYALVKIAAEEGQPGAVSQEQKMSQQMGGRDLIDADRHINDYRTAMAAFKKSEQDMAIALLGLVVDAAAVANRGEECSGRIPSLDARPSAMGEGAKIRMLPFPAGVVLADREASIKIALHVGRNGAICRSVAIERSRRPDLDDAAVYSSRMWTLSPALLNGEPVESVHIMSVTFRR